MSAPNLGFTLTPLRHRGRRFSGCPRPASPFEIIYYVDKVEKLLQYLDIKQEIRENLEEAMKAYGGLTLILVSRIVEILYGDPRFNKLDKEDIEHAIDTISKELWYKRQGPDKYAKFLKTRFDLFTDSTALTSSVLQAIEEGRTTDLDPVLEIKKLKSDYVNVFAREELVREKIVTFLVPPGTSTEDIKNSLTSINDAFFFAPPMEIISCHKSSSEEQYEMAHVTFKDAFPATTAILLAANGHLKISGERVQAIPTRYNLLPSDLNLPQHGMTEDVMAAYRKVQEDLLVDALGKFPTLIERLKRAKLIEKAEHGKFIEKAEHENADTNISKEPETLLPENGSLDVVNLEDEWIII